MVKCKEKKNINKYWLENRMKEKRKGKKELKGGKKISERGWEWMNFIIEVRERERLMK